MNMLTVTQTGLTAIIAQLQKQKEELTSLYHAAIESGKKLHEVKTIYITLKDIEKKLSDLLRISFSNIDPAL